MTRDEAELREYLGAAFDRSRLVRWQQQPEREAPAARHEAAPYPPDQA